MFSPERQSAITIHGVEAEENVIGAELSYTPDLQPFFSGQDFFAEYSTDLSDVPERLLAVPVLAHVCPVAWLQDASVHVPTLDAEFGDALREVNEALREMYPDLIGEGSLHCDRRVDSSSSPVHDGSGLLFTGGVDSMFSFIRHREETPALISVNGWTISNDEREKWDRKNEYLDRFAEDHDTDNYSIRSNMMSFYHHDVLRAYSEPHVDAVSGSWYTSIGHGLGLLGLCAPLTDAVGIGDLYMAASHWPGVSLNWGSCPSIDERVRWSGTRCHHDGYEYTRQERMEHIAEYVESEEPGLVIQTCSGDGGTNCSECEKCYRTAIGLLIAGLDPNDHGFDVDKESFDDIRRQFASGNWWVGENERIMWEDLQERATPDADYPCEGAGEFFQWLNEVDFRPISDQFSAPVRVRLRHVLYRHVPYPVFNALYDTPLYEWVRGNAIGESTDG